MPFATTSLKAGFRKVLSGSIFLLMAIWISCGTAAAGSYSADDYRRAEIRQMEAFYSRFSIRCDGYLFLASGDEFDKSSKIVFAPDKNDPATTANKLNDPGLVATVGYTIFVDGKARRHIPYLSIPDLSMVKATNWYDIPESFWNAKNIIPIASQIGRAIFKEYEDGITLTSFTSEGLGTPFVDYTQMQDAIYDAALHPERPWQKMSCSSFGTADTAIANFFMLENGDHSILDKLTEIRRTPEEARTYRKWLYAELRRLGVMGDNGNRASGPDNPASSESNKPPSQNKGAADKAAGKDMWTHNGSVVEIDAAPSGKNDGAESIEIRYVEPKASLMSEGVKSGTLLFNGSRKGDSISGTIRIFNMKCGTLEYAASGNQSSTGRIELKARRPVRANCAVTDRFVDEELVFEKK